MNFSRSFDVLPGFHTFRRYISSEHNTFKANLDIIASMDSSSFACSTTPFSRRFQRVQRVSSRKSLCVRFGHWIPKSQQSWNLPAKFHGKLVTNGQTVVSLDYIEPEAGYIDNYPIPLKSSRSFTESMNGLKIEFKGIFLLLYLFIPLINSAHFSIHKGSCIDQNYETENLGEAQVRIYHPRQHIEKVYFNEGHDVSFASKDKIATLKLAIKNGEKKLLQIIYSDSNQDNQLFDLYYVCESGDWKRTNENDYNRNLKILSNTMKTFTIGNPESWFSCSEGISDTKLCTINPYYNVSEIKLDDVAVWKNQTDLLVYGIGMSHKDTNEGPNLVLRIYSKLNGHLDNISLYVLLTQSQAESLKLLLAKSNSCENLNLARQGNSSENLNLTKHEPRKGVARVVDRACLKDITLVCDGTGARNYTVKHMEVMGCDVSTYTPSPGAEVEYVKDGEKVIWSTKDDVTKFVHAKFSYRNSLVLLNIQYTAIEKTSGLSKSVSKDEYFMKSEGWFTIDEARYLQLIGAVSDVVTEYLLQRGASHESLIYPNEETQADPPKAPSPNKGRLDNINLEIEGGTSNDYNKSVYLMDGLDTHFYYPKENKIVKFVKDGQSNIWSSDNHKRVLKHAKFQYRGDSHIYLQVLFYEPDQSGSKTKTNKTDYFVKRDQWYHSEEKDFFEGLNKLINKVTMKHVIENESKTFEEHITDLNFTKEGKKPGFIGRLTGKKPSVTKFKPFEYDISQDGKDKFLIEANLKEKFGIYTPNNGTALTRLFDEDKLIWYQETDGLGCTTFYIDLSGEYPLLHLLLDDPQNSNVYYKKQDGNWHLIDKKEYDEIRKPPNGPADPNDFRVVSYD